APESVSSPEVTRFWTVIGLPVAGEGKVPGLTKVPVPPLKLIVTIDVVAFASGMPAFVNVPPELKMAAIVLLGATVIPALLLMYVQTRVTAPPFKLSVADVAGENFSKVSVPVPAPSACTVIGPDAVRVADCTPARLAPVRMNGARITTCPPPVTL